MAAGNPLLGEHRRAAGQLIDEAGGKGMRVGVASVSREHANFIVTTPEATSKEVMELMQQVQRLVAEHHQVNPDSGGGPMAEPQEPLNITVLSGGPDAEAMISSEKSAAAISNALRTAGHHVHELDLPTDDPSSPCARFRKSRGFSVPLHGPVG